MYVYICIHIHIHDIILYYIILYFIVLNYMILYFIIFRYIVCYHITFYFIYAILNYIVIYIYIYIVNDTIYSIMLYYITSYYILFYFTIQALYKNSLYKKMRGWICLPHICFVEYICEWKIRNWGTLEFLRLRNLDVCEGAPLRPCSIFLTMKWLMKGAAQRQPRSYIFKSDCLWNAKKLRDPRPNNCAYTLTYMGPFR